jgi:tetratricopeptide (TPR) repeat protein
VPMAAFPLRLNFRPLSPPGTFAAMNSPSLWDRVRRARIVQVLAVYLGASWGVLQIADTLTEALALPAWVSPVAIILLLVGLVIIVATAWVQSLPATTAAEVAGDLPTDWEIAPSAAVESLKRGRLPHLTWGRVILGGIVSLSLLFGGAGLWVTLTGGPGVLGPTVVGAADVADGIAILPFNVTGVDDSEFWGEGMVDLLSTNLDGMGGYRTIDSRTLLARWRENGGDQASADLGTALRAAGQTGARYAVVGSAVGVGGGDMRLVAEIYDLDGGEEIGSGQVQGSSDDPLQLIDDLSLETMRLLLAGGGEELATTRNLADLTTSSVPALRAYLEGERYYRQAEFPRAVEAYQRALDADSTFALAIFRISDAYGWLESVNSETAIELGARAVEYIDDLSPRNAAIVAAGNGLYIGDMTQAAELERAVRRYPDDPEAWFMLAELYIHLGEGTGAGPEQSLEMIMKAIELDPGFAPYYVHAIDQNMILGNAEEARQLIEQYETFSSAEQLQEEYLVAFDLYFGDSAHRDAAWARMDGLSDMQIDIMCGTFCGWANDMPRSAEIGEYMRNRVGRDGSWYQGARYSVVIGKVARAEAMLRDSLPQGPDPQTTYLMHRFTDADVSDLLPVIRECDLGLGTPCTLWNGALAAEEGDWEGHAAAIEASEAAVVPWLADGDEITARFPQATADVLRGYGAFQRGDVNEARGLLTEAQGKSGGLADGMARVWLAQVNEELGRSQDAIRWYGLLRNNYMRSWALEQRARVAEEMGDLELARESWAAVVHNYSGADEGLARAVAARAALERLGG